MSDLCVEGIPRYFMVFVVQVGGVCFAWRAYVLHFFVCCVAPIPIEQVLFRNQKLPENHQIWIFLNLAFYSAPSLHNVDCCAFCGGCVFFWGGGGRGLACGVIFVLWLSRLGSSPTGICWRFGGEHGLFLWRFCRRVVVLFGVFFQVCCCVASSDFCLGVRKLQALTISTLLFEPFV